MEGVTICDLYYTEQRVGLIIQDFSRDISNVFIKVPEPEPELVSVCPHACLYTYSVIGLLSVRKVRG